MEVNIYPKNFRATTNKKGLEKNLLQLIILNKSIQKKEKNMSILEGIRSVITKKKVPKYLQEEVIKTMNYIQNRFLTKDLIHLTQKEACIEHKRNLSHL